MGADNVRGLLVFAEGKPLGQDGLRWLKIHLATVAGHDKASLEERVQFTMKHLDDIYDSCRKPLNGRRWWLQSEDAWQTLAACYELTQALDSPDPTKFVSHIPIQQDGTCNGLQHYAALGGDKIGARQVNLEPGDRPADVYTAVAEAVKERIRQDAEQGNAIAQKLDGRITRKCVKQPVMTNVYGVTFYGARLQVKKQLEVLFPEVRSSESVNVSLMSHYVTTKIFQCLGTMFGGAQAIQNWLGVCADRVATCLTPEQVKHIIASEQTRGIAPMAQESNGRPTNAERQRRRDGKKKKAEDTDNGPGVNLSSTGSDKSERTLYNSSKPLFKSTVVWTTPLRLPVVQPYRTSKSTRVKTNMQDITLQEPQVWDPVSKRKQLQAFPPNFVHSLDATHMLLSAMKCTESGMTFASIHDSFWTHACDVNSLSHVLRDAFVEMHSDDVIGRLREEFQTRYKGCMYLASVRTDTPVAAKIIKHRRALKDLGSHASELALEAERLRLLDSEDAEERKKGEEMVTPGSIMAAEGDEGLIAAPTEMQGQTLGDMPEEAGYEATNPDADASALEIEDLEAAAVPKDGEPEADNEAGTDTDLSAEAAPSDGSPEDGSGNVSASPKVKAGPITRRKIFVWLPVTFPKVPPKGGFDVTRLRASRYFFH